jgi:hypothetical protein
MGNYRNPEGIRAALQNELAAAKRLGFKPRVDEILASIDAVDRHMGVEPVADAPARKPSTKRRAVKAPARETRKA